MLAASLHADCAARTPTALDSLGSPARRNDEEEDWAANPWQEQVDAHILQLRQAGAVFPHVPGSAPAPNGFHGSAFKIPAALGSVPMEAELQKRNSELEGHAAYLAEVLAMREKELEQALEHVHLSPSGRPIKSTEVETLLAQAAELRRRNDHLSAVISRFERKTMDLEEEIAGLTSARQLDRETLAAPLQDRVNELEGQVVLLEDTVARKDGEFKDIQARFASEELDRRACEKHQRLNKQAMVDVGELRKENTFLSKIVSRFEEKTTSLQRQLEAEAAARKLDHEVLQERGRVALARCSELEQANAEVAERSEEQRQAVEGSALLLRNCKKDHNQKMQDLLRRMQSLEKQKRDLQASNDALVAAAAEEAVACSDADAEISGAPSASKVDEEIVELRLLNEQLIERLGSERAGHTDCKHSLRMALQDAEMERVKQAQTKLELGGLSRENETMSIRLEYIRDQLFDLTTRNDTLQEELAVAEKRGGSSLQGSPRVSEDGLHKMS